MGRKNDIIRRLDEHLAVANAHMERTNAHMERTNELMAENRKALAEHNQSMQDIRFELSQMSLRGERVAEGFIAVLRDLREDSQALRDDSQAHRRALLAILDRLENGGGPAAAGAA